MRRLIAAVALLGGATARAQPASSCPDSLQTPRLIDYELGRAHAAWKRDQSGAVPPTCVFSAMTWAPLAHSDSAIIQALELTAEALRRSPGDAPTLRARMVLLSRAGRYAEVGPTMDELFMAGPSRITEAEHRLAIAAAMRLRDTAMIINRLANGAGRFPRARHIVGEYEVWRQLPRLRAVVDTVHRRLREDPTLVEAYATLASIYGNLDQLDSTLSYVRIARTRGVRRSVIATALESLIGVKLRRAQIFASPDVWHATLPVALAIDSALSTPASKYLVALTMSEVVADEARLAQEIWFALEAGIPEGYGRLEVRPDGRTVKRVLNCDRLTELRGMIATAREKLAAGGERFTPETVPAIRAGLSRMTAVLAQLAPRCPA